MAPRWTKKELQVLQDSYNAGMSTIKVAEILNRSITAIQQKAQGVGLKHQCYWSTEQDKILQREYIKGTNTSEIAKLLNRSRSAIQCRASDMNLEHPCHWTKEEETILQDSYNDGTPVMEILKKINRSEASIISRAHYLGLTHSYFTGHWGKHASYQKTLIYRLQDESHCVICGRRDYLTINHIYHKWQTIEHHKEMIYWLNHPEEARENLNVMCFNCNKLEYYNYIGADIIARRKICLEKIAMAHDRSVECFECKYSEDIRVLEIDHMKQDKYNGVYLIQRILDISLDEIRERYQILCTNHNAWKSRRTVI